MSEWRLMTSTTAKKQPCHVCGTVSGWHPKDWWFRYVPISGRPRKGNPKVITWRLCPECAVKEGLTQHA